MNNQLKDKSMSMKNMFATAMLLVASQVYVCAQATLTMSDFEIMPGESKTVTIDMTNSLPIRAFQVQVVFPEGVTMASRPTVVPDREGSYEDEFGETVQCTKTLGYNKWEDGSYMITVNADDAIPFSGTEGPVITFKVKAAADAALGETSITLQDMELVYEDGYTYVRPESTTCKVTVYHKHTPGEDGVCTSCSEPVELVIDDTKRLDFQPEYTTYAKMTYNRKIAEGTKYATLTLPFAPDAASCAVYAFYTLTSVNGDCIYFDEVETPVANTPYLYCVRDGQVEGAITGDITAPTTELVETQAGGWSFVGSLTNQVIDCASEITNNNVYHYAYYAPENVWNRVLKSLTVIPYRAFLKQNANVQTARMRIFIGDATGIHEVPATEIDGLCPEVIYDLQGRVVSHPVKGQIYLIGGEKRIYR